MWLQNGCSYTIVPIPSVQLVTHIVPVLGCPCVDTSGLHAVSSWLAVVPKSEAALDLLQFDLLFCYLLLPCVLVGLEPWN